MNICVEKFNILQTLDRKNIDLIFLLKKCVCSYGDLFVCFSLGRFDRLN